MTIQIDAFLRALVFVAIIGTGAGLAINFVSPAHAFYGSLNRDGNPVWECYEHPDHANCK
jgi:hypothetical protein